MRKTPYYGDLLRLNNIGFSGAEPIDFYRFSWHFKVASPQGNGYCVCPIICVKLIHEVLYVEIHRGLSDRESVGYFLVSKAVADEREHLQFPGREVLFPKALGNAGSNLGRDVFFAGMDSADYTQQLVLVHALQNISTGARSHRPLDLANAVRSCQDNDPRVMELSSDCYERIRAVCAREAEIHQRNVRPKAPVFVKGFCRVGCLAHEDHVRLRTDDRRKTFTKNRMVFDGKYSDGLCVTHRPTPGEHRARRAQELSSDDQLHIESGAS